MPRSLSILAFVSLTMISAVRPAIGAEASPPSERQVEFFETHVRPIFVKHCYECHSTENGQSEGGLVLDSRHGWMSGGDSGQAVIPKDVESSLLISAVKYDSFEMPPSGKLPDDAIKTLEQWVAMGAPDPRDAATATAKREIDIEQGRKFWSFQPPRRHPLPSVEDGAWPLTDVDRFLLARLEQAGLSPAPDAPRHVWLRRTTFDLIGLPPTVQEIGAFLEDETPDAHARVVDRLLARPQFGEHWGRKWLDVARYADTNGGDFNATFYNAWRYRNWVLRSFNADLPYDRFVRAQIAGDLAPHSDERERADNLVATTYLMLGAKMLSERDKERLRMDVIDEQVDTVGRSLLGLTIGCARCHDHKFDPIPTRDYYALAGIFHSSITLEGESQQYVSTWKHSPLPVGPEHAQALADHKKEMAGLDAQIKLAQEEAMAAKAKLASLQGSRDGVIVDDEDAEIVGDWKQSTYSPRFIGKGYRHDNQRNKGELSVTFTPDLSTAGEYEVRLSYTPGKNRAKAAPVLVRHGGGEATVLLDQQTAPSIGNLFEPIGRFYFEAGRNGSVTIANRNTTGYVIIDAAQFVLVDDLAKTNDVDAEEISAARAAKSAAEEKFKELEAAKKSLADSAPSVPEAMAIREDERIADCCVRIRGEHRNLGPKVSRGFLQVADSPSAQRPASEQSGRLELADWITHQDNPLTARVMVNRLWLGMFGKGMVPTPDNFGRLGQPPSHPMLLDELAIDFMRSDWSIKKAIRKLANSRARRMSGTANPAAAKVDAENRLLWRMPRRRLTAESIRDSMLAASHRLDNSVGVEPVASMKYLAIASSGKRSADLEIDTRRRRSVYLPIVRNDLPEILAVFDFADPDMVVGRRSTTNVPAQSLFLMNNPFVIQCADDVARRLLADGRMTNEQRLSHAWRLLFGREPDRLEQEQSMDYLGGGGHESWRNLIHALMASVEFRMVN